MTNSVRPPTAAQGEATFVQEIVACLERVRDHVYERNVGGLAVETGLDLLALKGDPEDDGDPTGGLSTTWPTIVRGEGPRDLGH